ncbi:FBP domain-containing protein [Rhodococcus ruber]|uniref:FBP domain-containing protein n=1 Tax=Rhodococcus ruber TaxID=1830 RepID=UPI0009E8E480|nr:FBP domain-containing protein [Rhodococcus ruber]
MSAAARDPASPRYRSRRTWRFAGAHPGCALPPRPARAHRTGGTSLFTARKAGAGGKAGNSIGTYMCSNFACSLYVRELAPLPGNQPDRALPTETRIRRLGTRLGGFVGRVLDEQEP